MPLPTVTQTAAQTVFTNKVYAVWTPPGVSPTKVNMVADLVDYDGSSDIKDTLFPGDDGLLRPLRRDQTKSEESFMLKLYDLEKVKAILGGLNGFVDGGKLQLFITDPKDASGKVRLQTDDFPCSAQRDGQVKFGGQEASTATLKFVSTKTSAISFTFNGDVPA
jgi:hypothetical protein